MKRYFIWLALAIFAFSLTGCLDSSLIANLKADGALYQSVNYTHSNKKGPTVIVLPGKIKSSNATFTQKVSANNIADFAEIELSKANFRVLERSDLGPMLREITLAANRGDGRALRKFKRGKFKSTKWFLKFDILKAELVANASGGIVGGALGSITSILLGGKAGALASVAGRSTKIDDSAKVWIIGLRYKILDASTSEQVSSGYIEKKMEAGSKGAVVMGIRQDLSTGVTLDTLAQRLVQSAVVEIDRQK